MPTPHNIYCDESCHLEHDGIPVMVLGAVWCPTDKAAEACIRLREIKVRHGLPSDFEVKWTKISPARVDFYRDIVDYFFDNTDLHFRGVLVPDKAQLNHTAFSQTHHEWYYKMMFHLLEVIIHPTERYRVYLDLKDTHAWRKCQELQQVIRNARHDHGAQIIERVQPIRSHESELMQLADLLIGAVAYTNRGLATSPAKKTIAERVIHRSGKNLKGTTWLQETKFNLLKWAPQGGSHA